MQNCQLKTAKISPFEAHFGCKPYTPQSAIATKPKLSNLSYENIVNNYLDEVRVTPAEILPDDKWVNGYRSDIEVDLGMSDAARNANNREQASTDGESRFIRTSACRPIPVTRGFGPRVAYIEGQPNNLDHQRARQTNCNCSQ